MAPVDFERLHGGAVRIDGPCPATKLAFASKQFVWPHQQGFRGQMQRISSAVAVVEDVLPLRHAVHRKQQGEALFLQPPVGRLGLLILNVPAGKLCKRPVPVRNADDAFKLRATSRFSHEAA